MRLFEMTNRLAWIILVVSFMLKRDSDRKVFQVFTLVILIGSYILEGFGL